MTPTSRLAAAPIVAFGVSFAVVLALGQLVTPSSGTGGPPATPPAASPQLPAPETPDEDDDTSSEAPEEAPITRDAKGYFVLEQVTAEKTFTGFGMQAHGRPVRSEEKVEVEVCVATPPDTAIPHPGWWESSDEGSYCAVVAAASTVRFSLVPAS